MGESYVVVIVTHNRLDFLKDCLMHVESQTVAAKWIIVVDNASEDDTAQYLREKSANSQYRIITCTENIGGAGGFEKGIGAVLCMEQIDCVLLIDDDAMLSNDYMEKILTGRRNNINYQAFAGAVEDHGAIDVWHRRRKASHGIRLKHCPVSDYKKDYFSCDIASFCGMVVGFLVIPSARLIHRTITKEKSYPHRRYDWREYYGIRNRLWYVQKHGSVLDRLVNGADMFCNIVFRNWLFGALKMDGYDWMYEKTLVRRAYRDARQHGRFLDEKDKGNH